MSAAESESDPTFINRRWATNNLGVSGTQGRAIADAYVTREQLLDALASGEDLTSNDGIGEKTASALWRWYKEDYGETVKPEGELLLDDDGLHLPEWLVGYVGQFTVETPTLTIQPTTTDQGLGEVSSILGSYPEAGTWNERLSEGQIALTAPGSPERVYEIDDQRSSDGDAE